jgi:hypothetical protein
VDKEALGRPDAEPEVRERLARLREEGHETARAEAERVSASERAIQDDHDALRRIGSLLAEYEYEDEGAGAQAGDAERRPRGQSGGNEKAGGRRRDPAQRG